MTAPRVSVLLSVHNGAGYLRAAIDSILAQTLTDLELIVVDDASTDDSAAVCREYAESDSRVRLFHNDQRRGLTASLNYALAAARGEFIARMDADDVSLPHRLETQLRYLEARPDVGLVGSFYTEIGADGEVRVPVYRFPVEPIVVAWKMAFENPLPHPPIVVRKRLLEAVGGYDEQWRTSQDYDLFVRLSAITKLANCPEVLFQWRRHGESVSSISNAEQRASALRISRAYISTVLAQPVSEAIVELLWRRRPANAAEATRFIATAIAICERITGQRQWTDDERRCLRHYVSRHLLYDVVPYKAKLRGWTAIARLCALSPSLIPEIGARRWGRLTTRKQPVSHGAI